MEVSIVVPTYNEAENLPELISQLAGALKNYHWRIIVVDDGSSDGTAKIASDLGAKVISRPEKMGLSSAVLEGIRESETELIVVMDADLQHPPQFIPELLKEAENYDLVIASRYLKDSQIENWNFLRKIISKVAIFLAKIFLPKIREIKDPVSNFFLLKKSKILEMAEEIKPMGSRLLLTALARGNFKVKEIPVNFGKRFSGQSKFGLTEIINFLKFLIFLSKSK